MASVTSPPPASVRNNHGARPATPTASRCLSTHPAFDLTVHNTASGAYALGVLTVVAVLLFPVVIGYQGWTYYVFRARLRPEDFRGPTSAR